MPSSQPVNGTTGAAPAAVAASGIQTQTSATRPSFEIERDWLWKPHIGDVTLVLRALAVSYGAIFGLLLFLVPGAAALAAAAFWHPDLVFTWPISLAIALGASVGIWIVLMIVTAPIGGQVSPCFILLTVAALVTLWVVRHRDPILVDALWNHLTR